MVHCPGSAFVTTSLVNVLQQADELYFDLKALWVHLASQSLLVGKPDDLEKVLNLGISLPWLLVFFENSDQERPCPEVVLILDFVVLRQEIRPLRHFPLDLPLGIIGHKFVKVALFMQRAQAFNQLVVAVFDRVPSPDTECRLGAYELAENVLEFPVCGFILRVCQLSVSLRCDVDQRPVGWSCLISDYQRLDIREKGLLLLCNEVCFGQLPIEKGPIFLKFLELVFTIASDVKQEQVPRIIVFCRLLLTLALFVVSSNRGYILGLMVHCKMLFKKSNLFGRLPHLPHQELVIEGLFIIVFHQLIGFTVALLQKFQSSSVKLQAYSCVINLSQNSLGLLEVALLNKLTEVRHQ